MCSDIGKYIILALQKHCNAIMDEIVFPIFEIEIFIVFDFKQRHE